MPFAYVETSHTDKIPRMVKWTEVSDKISNVHREVMVERSLKSNYTISNEINIHVYRMYRTSK